MTSKALPDAAAVARGTSLVLTHGLTEEHAALILVWVKAYRAYKDHQALQALGVDDDSEEVKALYRFFFHIDKKLYAELTAHVKAFPMAVLPVPLAVWLAVSYANTAYLHDNTAIGHHRAQVAVTHALYAWLLGEGD